ncbi:hypothetical protein GCM10025734_17780 [Kitasatospora paranensis]
MAGLHEQGGHRAVGGRSEELAQPGSFAFLLRSPLGDAVVGVAGDGELQESKPGRLREVGEGGVQARETSAPARRRADPSTLSGAACERNGGLITTTRAIVSSLESRAAPDSVQPSR